MRAGMSTRVVAFTLLTLGLVGLTSQREVRADEVKCYDGITEIACPSAPATDSCELQFDRLPADQKVWQTPLGGCERDRQVEL